MKKVNYPVIFAILCALQIFISVVFRLPRIMAINILPMLILYLPVKVDTPSGLVIAFAAGFAADFLSDGMLGLTSACLLPVALLRRPLLLAVSGREIISYKSGTPASHQHIRQMAASISIATLLFFVIYVWVDGAGLRPFVFNAGKVAVSTMTSSLASFLIAGILFADKT